MSELNLNDDTFLTKSELAARWRVGTRTIENWVREGKCPSPIRVSSRKSLFRLDDVIEQEIEWQHNEA